jgi:hypothetical protein
MSGSWGITPEEQPEFDEKSGKSGKNIRMLY